MNEGILRRRFKRRFFFGHVIFREFAKMKPFYGKTYVAVKKFVLAALDYDAADGKFFEFFKLLLILREKRAAYARKFVVYRYKIKFVTAFAFALFYIGYFARENSRSQNVRRRLLYTRRCRNFRCPKTFRPSAF